MIFSSDADPCWRVFKNDGTGVFSVGERLKQPIESRATLVGIVDMNADGHEDYVTTHGPSGSWPSPYKGTAVVTSGPFDELLQGCPPGEVGPRHAVESFADWDHDGDLDYWDFGSRMRLHTNDGTGTFTVVEDPDLPQGDLWGLATAVGDFDGDGYDDRIVAHGRGSQFVRMELLRTDSDRTWTYRPAAEDGVEIRRKPGRGGSGEPRPTGDIDGDGDTDVLYDNGHWENDGTGFFPRLVGSYQGTPLWAGDLDRNGALDLLVCRPGGLSCQGGTLTALWGEGGGVFREQRIGLWNGASRIHALDLDGNGSLELVVPQGRTDYQVLRVEGATLHLVQAISWNGIVDSNLAAMDVNDDGLADLVGVRDNGHQFLLCAQLRLPGPLAYGDSWEWVMRLAPSQPPFETVSFSFGDMDGDGDLDISGAPNQQYAGDAAGYVRQYGSPNPGQGGEPLLGGRGPFRYRAPDAELRVSGLLGGTLGLLAVSATEDDRRLTRRPQVPDAHRRCTGRDVLSSDF